MAKLAIEYWRHEQHAQHYVGLITQHIGSLHIIMQSLLAQIQLQNIFGGFCIQFKHGEHHINTI